MYAMLKLCNAFPLCELWEGLFNGNCFIGKLATVKVICVVAFDQVSLRLLTLSNFFLSSNPCNGSFFLC